MSDIDKMLPPLLLVFSLYVGHVISSDESYIYQSVVLFTLPLPFSKRCDISPTVTIGARFRVDFSGFITTSASLDWLSEFNLTLARL